MKNEYLKNSTVKYNDLLQLTKYEGTPFYISEQEKDGEIFHVFSYRLASYGDFIRPFAMETRGSMFHKKANGFTLVSRPMCKFFNAYENPITMFDDKEYKVSDIAYAMTKLDGSVINSYMIGSNLYLKSHTSTKSEQAEIANKLLDENSELFNATLEAEIDEYTVTFEYTAPTNRIVVAYNESKLTVLNLRHRVSGELLLGDEIKELYPVLYEYSVFKNTDNIHKDIPIRETLSETIAAVRQMTGIEGFVFVFKNGAMCKVKTDWYCSLHFSRDSIMIPSRLFNVVIEDAGDDLRQLFSTDEYAINLLENMERVVFMCYNELVSTVEEFVAKYKHLERKEFALKVKEEVPNKNGAVGAVFTLYDGRTPDYKALLIRNSKSIIDQM